MFYWVFNPQYQQDIRKMKRESFIAVMSALYNLFDAPDKFLKVVIIRSFNDFVVMFPFMTMLPSIIGIITKFPFDNIKRI